MGAFYQGKLLREGVSAGNRAAAAAVLGLLSACPEAASVTTAAGLRETPIHSGRPAQSGFLCPVIKEAGDVPDVTNGPEICAYVELTVDGQVRIDGGQGVGRVTREARYALFTERGQER